MKLSAAQERLLARLGRGWKLIWWRSGPNHHCYWYGRSDRVSVKTLLSLERLGLVRLAAGRPREGYAELTPEGLALVAELRETNS